MLQNSIALSPFIQAKHLDRKDPSIREECMKELRSYRGGGQVKRSRLSTPPSPTLETPVDFIHESLAVADIMGDDFTLNATTKN